MGSQRVGHGWATFTFIGQVMGIGLRVSLPSLNGPISPNLHVFTILGALWISLFWFIIEALLRRHNCWNHWLQMTKLHPGHFFLLGSWWEDRGQKVRILNCMTDSNGSQSPSLGAFQKLPHYHKSSCGERGLLWITWYPFHLYSSEAILGTVDKRQNIITRGAPIVPIIQTISRVLGSVS